MSRGSVPETTVSINDDDAPSSLTVNFKKSGYTVTEGSIEEIVLTLDDDPERTVTIPLSWSNEDGASDSDHNGVPTDVTFNAGETEKSFEFSAVSDRIGDQGETVSIKLGAPPSGVTKGTTSETVVTIEDVAPLGSTTVSFGADTYGVSEGSFTTITVVMSHAPGSDATIPIMATNQGDTSNADYLLSATSVIFGPTDTSKTFKFTATQDSVDDDEESVDLGFGTLPGGVSAGLVPKTTVSITDDDVPAVEVSFEHSSYTVAESDDASTTSEKENEVTVKVTLSAEPERTVDIPLILTNQGASDADYLLSATSVIFGPTDTSKTFTFTATQDSVDDDEESVDLGFGTLPGGVSAGLVPKTTVSINDDDVPSVTVSFGSATYPVDEGETETVTVTLSAAPEREVVVPIDTTDEGGASSDDYSLSETSVTFGPTETSKTFTFTAADDAEDDDGESVKLTFGSALPAGVSRGSVPETTVSINDDDVPSVTVSFGSATYPVDEGETETVTVTLSAAPEREVVVPIDTTDEGGASSDDYSLSETSVTFGPTETSKTFTFTAADDAEDDDGESVKLTFGSALPAGVSRGSVPETTVSINDDDVPSVTVSFGSATYPVDEGETETVTVTLSAAPEREVVVPIDTADEGGASSDDYSLSETSVTFGPTETSKTFTFTAADDAEDDDGESVKLTFGSALPAGVSRGSVPETTVSINDDDAPSSLTVNFKKSGYTVTEGSIEEIVLTLDDDPERTVTIPLSWSNEDGASDSDHNGVPTDVTFNAGETEKSFEFSAVSDRIGDQGETVSIKLGAPPSGVTKGTTSETVVTIEDVAPLGSTTVSFGADTYGVSEGSFTTITVVMSHAPGSDATIPIMATNQGDTSNADYLLSATSVIFGPTDTSKTFKFTATQDSVDDDEESVDLGFGTLPGGVSAGLVPKTTVSITDDDVPAVEVSFEHSSYTVAESDDASTTSEKENEVTVKVTLSAEPERTVDIPLILTNQGASDADYLLSATSVIFGPTDTSKTFTFTATQDSVDDDEESVDLGFGTLPGGVSAGLVPKTTVSINDDDVPSVTVSFGSATYPVDEGETETVTVTLSAAPEREVVVPIDTTDEGGASSDDYSLSETSVTFGPTETSKTFTFTAADDAEDDDGESVKLTFGSALPAGVSRGSVPETTVSINDDDVPSVTVSFGSATYPVDEGETETVTVTLSAAPEREVVVPIDTTDEGGASSDDYSLSETSVTFGPTETSKTFTFTAADDAEDDDGESVKLTFGSALPAGVSRGSVPETTVSINDDDVPSVTVSFGSATYPVDEGETETVTVTLSAAPEREVVVPIDTADEGGASSDDYSLSETSVTFGPTETSKTFTFTATQDTVDDDGESVKLTFDSQLPAGVSRGSVPETTVSINDDDAPSSLTVNFKKSGYTVTEGSIEEIVLTLDDDPERTVTIPLSWSNEDGASDSDHNGVPTDVTFNAGETEKSFEFSAVSDRIGDQGETVSIKLGAPPSGVTKGTTSETVVTIEDVAPLGSTTVSFGADTYGVSEGSFTTITVVMSHAPGSDATIPIMATNQGDTSNADYLLSATSVIFGPTDTSKTFKFTATQDSVDDDEESVDLGFGTLPGGVSAGLVPKTTVSITDDDVPAVEVSFEHSSYTVAESDDASTTSEKENEVTVKVTLSAEPERTVDIPLILTNQGASDADYLLSATSVIFGPTDTSKTFTFTATQDSVDDDEESVDLGFGTLPGGVSAGLVPKTTVSINDDDVPSVTVSFGSATYPVDEGETETVTVTLSAAPEREVVVPIDTTDEGGASSDDYSLSETSVTFGPTETSKTFTFTAADDAEDDDGESVKLTFGSALPAGVSRGSVPETTVSINDDDVPSVTVSFGSATYPVDEGETETVTVTLSAAPEREVVVPIDTTDEGGASSDDYSLSETSVTFGPTETSKTFTFTAADDAEDDDGESVKLTFGSALPAGVSRGSVPETTVSINDDDVPSVTVSFGSATYPVDEGETETVTVTLSAAPEREVVVPIDTADEGGASSDDYSLSETSVTFGPTETSKTFTFTAADDAEDDDGESVKLTFGSALPAGVSRGSVPETTVSINDDDAPSSLTVNFKKSGYTVTEGSIEEIVLTLDDDPERTVTIPLSWSNEDGASDSDHNGVPTDVTFNAGETEKSFEFSAVSDRIGDQGETVSIKLGAPPSGVTKGTTSETVVTIEDVAPLGSTTVSFGADTYGVSEGSFTTITVVMSHAPGSDATIPIMATNQGDTSNADYLLSATSVIFGPTDTSKTFKFTATQDSVDDDEESVDLGFGTLPGGVSAGLVPKTTVSITDDDVPAVEVSFEHSSYTVAESDDASTTSEKENEVTVKVTLSAEPERTVDIPLILTNQGASDADYLLSATSVIFGPTDTSKTFTFTATQDSVDDDEESVDLGFGTLPGGVSAGLVPKTTVSINDDDVPSVTVSFGSATYPVDEGETETVTVTLSAAPEREVVVPIDTTDEGGASSDDYSLSETSVTFGPTETSKTFTFTAADDAEDDDGESVKLTFGSALPAGVSRGSVPETTVSINDDDVPSVTVSFGSATYPVDEGETETVTVTLSAAPEREVVVPIDTTDEGGASSDDYSLSETSVTFGPTETSKTFTFTAADDAEDDDGESVKLTFGSALPAGVSRGSVPETTVSINDDDVPSVTVSFGSATYPVDEGETETVTVTLSAAPEREVVVPIDTADEGGASSDDYSLSETSVTFGPTETSKTFTFTATQDTVDDDGESVKLTFDSQLPAGVSRGSVPETTVSINDDDAPSSLTVNFKKSGYTVTEGSIEEIVLTLDDDPERTVTIPLSWSNEDGASDSDHNGVPTDVTFNAGETEKSFEFSASRTGSVTRARR